MSLFAFRDAYSRDAGNIDFGTMWTSGSMTAGQPTPWFSLTPHKGKSNVLGVIFKGVCQVTVAGGAGTPNTGADALDLWLGPGAQIDMTPAPGASGRSQSLTRQFVEFMYAVATNVAFTIAAPATFASAGNGSITVSWFVPVGGEAAAIRLRLPSTVQGAASSGPVPGYAYTASNTVTVSYTSLTAEVVSSNFTGVCAFREEKSPSLGSGMQDCMAWLPKDVAPDVGFLFGDTSTSITQVLIESTKGVNIIDSTDTDALQLGAAAIAPISGATFTTTAGFVLSLDGNAFGGFRLNFASSTIHYIGFFQCSGGATAEPGITPGPTPASPAVAKTGSVTAAGQVSAMPKGSANVANRGGRYQYRQP